MSKAAFRALRERVSRVADEIEREQRWQRESEGKRLEGIEARRSGAKAAQNPYAVGTAHRKAWADGWNAEHERLGGRRAA
jgi:hypothetical protein